MRYSVEPCRLGHALYVARHLGQEKRDIFARAGMSCRHTFAEYWRDSSESWVLKIDGEVAAIGGWRGALLGREAEAWLSLLPLALKRWRTLVRVLVLFRERLASYRVVAFVVADSERDCRFAAYFGLRPVGEARGGIQLMSS